MGWVGAGQWSGAGEVGLGWVRCKGRPVVDARAGVVHKVRTKVLCCDARSAGSYGSVILRQACFRHPEPAALLLLPSPAACS